MSQTKTAGPAIRQGYKEKSWFAQLFLNIKAHPWLYIMFLPVLAYFIIFHYWPMYGIIIAFKDFRPAQGIWGSRWAGLKYFERYFNSYMFTNTIVNTLVISL